MITLTRIIPVVFISLCLMLKANAEGEATLSGTVKDAAGQPLQGAEIRIQGRDANKVGKIHTNASGHYNYPALETGTYSVTLLVGGVTKASITNVRTKAGETQTLNFDLQKGAAKPFAKGKHYVWIPEVTGSHLGYWVEADDSGKTVSTGLQQRMANQGNEMIRNMNDEHPGISLHP